MICDCGYHDIIIPYPGCASELPITTPAPEIPPSKNYLINSPLAKATTKYLFSRSLL